MSVTPDYVPERVQRLYKETDTTYTYRGTMEVYHFTMTEGIPVSAIEEQFNVCAFNEGTHITGFGLE